MTQFDIKTGNVTNWNSDSEKQLTSHITAITEDRNGKLWVCDDFRITHINNSIFRMLRAKHNVLYFIVFGVKLIETHGNSIDKRIKIRYILCEIR